MAYQQPKYWSHGAGDRPTAAELNKVSANLNELLRLQLLRDDASNGLATGTALQCNLVHYHPWLFYISESEEAPGEIGPWDESLAERSSLPYAPEGGYYHLDDGLFWMVVGAVYCVEHVRVAMEVPEAVE